MSLLSKRFPPFSMLPRVPLVKPTRVERLDTLSARLGGELWVKRDDLTNPLYGGNKVRKLERILGEARRRERDVLIAAGAFGSHHVLATTLFGKAWGFDVHAVLVPQPWTTHVDENLRVGLDSGLVPHVVRTWAAVPPSQAALKASLRLEGRRPFNVAYGGSSPLGTIGYVEAGLELAGQIENRELPEPEAVYVALGSAGTAVGLAIGLAAAGLTTRVIAVRVTPALVCNRATIASLVASTMHELRGVTTSFPAVGRAALAQIELDSTLYGAGYGTRDPAAEEASELARDAGLMLDGTYTARAFAALVRRARKSPGGHHLYWHTLSSVDLSERAATSPEVPAHIREAAFKSTL